MSVAAKSRPINSRNALGADHAAVGDDADAADAKTSAQSVDDRQQGGDIGGVAGCLARPPQIEISVSGCDGVPVLLDHLAPQWSFPPLRRFLD
jgi:hypothetical protein